MTPAHRSFPSPLVGEGGANERSELATGEGYSCLDTDPSPAFDTSPTRGEGKEASRFIFQTATPAYSRGANHPGFAKHRPSKNRGRRECRVLQRTRSLACKMKKAHELVTTGSPKHSGIPCTNGFNGFLRALVSAKSARMCERAVLTNRPSLDLSPIVLEGRKSLSGSVGQVRCLPQPEQLHGL